METLTDGDNRVETVNDRNADGTKDAKDLILEQRLYDVFGTARPNTDYSANTDSWMREGITSHGFTGHEHLLSGLIHMNGRAYDPALGRFLSVDPFVAMPENGQSINPYSYVMNNPLKYTDPSGYAQEEATEDDECKDKKDCAEDFEENKPDICSRVGVTCMVAVDPSTGRYYYVIGNGVEFRDNSASNQPLSSKSCSKANPGGCRYGSKSSFDVDLRGKVGLVAASPGELSFVNGFLPSGVAADVYTSVMGEDFFTSEEISGFWRWAGLIPFVSEARKFGNIADFGKASLKVLRQSDSLGGFAKGISVDEITAINKQFSSGATLTGDISTVLANAANRDGFFNKSASIIRDIAGGHLFENGNKRTAQAVVESLMQRNGITTGPNSTQLRAIVNQVGKGHLKSVDDIATALRGY